MAALATSQDFIDLIAQSGLLDRGRLDAHLAPLYARGAVPNQPDQLAAILVRDGLLTSYQTRQLLAGKWRGFFILGKYKLLDLLGSGGMGKVFLCEHMHLRQMLAVKVLPAADVSTPGALERFYREARASASLNHPNIVRAFDVDRDGDIHFLVMEYIDGSDLQHIVTGHGPLPISRACNYIRQASLGLQNAHEAGWVHRDIKPGNILLNREGVIKLLDLGLARLFHNSSDNLTKQHAEGSVLGTADYIAPEQAVSSHDADVRADIYSLGATFYFLLAGQPPFAEGSVAHKLIWHQMRQPKPITQLRPEVPEPVAAVIEKMMMKDPNQRFQQPGEIAEALLMYKDAVPPPDHEMPSFNPNSIKLGLSDLSAGMAAMGGGRPAGGTNSLVDVEEGDMVHGTVPTVNIRQSGIPTPPSSTAQGQKSPSASPPARPKPAAPSGRYNAPPSRSMQPPTPTALPGSGVIPPSGVMRRPPAPTQLPGSSLPGSVSGTANVSGGARSIPPAVAASQTMPPGAASASAKPQPGTWPDLDSDEFAARVGQSRTAGAPPKQPSAAAHPAAAKPPAKRSSTILLMFFFVFIIFAAGGAALFIWLKRDSADTGRENQASNQPQPQPGKPTIDLPPGYNLYVTKDHSSPYFNKSNVSHSIKEALERANENDKIALLDPVIEEEVDIDGTDGSAGRVPRNLTIVGNPFDKAKPAKWNPRSSNSSGDRPLLKLINTQGLLLKGIEFDGLNKVKTTILVEGLTPKLSLEESVIRGFKDQAVLLRGAHGTASENISLSQLSIISPGSGEDCGVVLLPSPGSSPQDAKAIARDLVIQDTLFKGKFRAAIRAEGPVDRVQVRKSRFYSPTTAVSLKPTDPTLPMVIKLFNNTFFVRQVVTLENQPGDTKAVQSVVLKNNLFTNTPSLAMYKDGSSPDKGDPNPVKLLFDQSTNNFCDDSSFAGVKYPWLTVLNRVEIWKDPKDDKKLLRYPPESDAFTAGEGGSSVGAPPE